MARRYKTISEQPYRSIIVEEWRKAVKTLAPLLSWTSRPIVVWDRKLGNRNPSFYRAKTSPSSSPVGLWTGSKYQWFERGTIEMAINPPSEDVFRLTLRHEIAHWAKGSHGHDGLFVRSLNALGGTRHAFAINPE